MANALGTKSKMALVKGAVWKTAVDLTTNHRVPFKSCGVVNKPEQIEDETMADGASTRRPSINGNESNDGPLELQADYRQHLLMNALLMGSAGVPTEIDVGASYKHVMKFQKTTDGLFATMGLDQGGVSTAEGSKKAEAWASVKPGKWTLRSAAGGKAMESFDIIGAGYFQTEDPAAWTYPAATDPSNGGGRTLVHARSAFKCNAQSGGALGAGDAFYPNEIEIVVDRNYSKDFSNGVDPNEPTAGGFADIRLRLTFYTATRPMLDLFRDAMRAETLLKASIVFTHTKLIGATATPYSRSFFFPKLKVVDAPLPVEGPGNLPYKVELTAHLATAAPTGFGTGYVEELIQEWANEISANPLA